MTAPDQCCTNVRNLAKAAPDQNPAVQRLLQIIVCDALREWPAASGETSIGL
jgi:hypothetical protein